MRGEASYNESTRNPEISADVDLGCAWAQITCKHTDDTQINRIQEIRQNVDKQNKNSEYKK